jgi:hypothetical protein
LRAAGKEGVIRIERDRQGAIRVFPGANLAAKPAMPVDEPEILDVEEEVYDAPVEAEVTVFSEPVEDAPIVDVEAVVADDEEQVIEEPVDEAPEPVATAAKGARKRKSAGPRAAKPRTSRTAKPRARKAAKVTS